MVLITPSSRPVSYEDYPEAAGVGVSGRGLTADVGQRSGDENRVDVAEREGQQAGPKSREKTRCKRTSRNIGLPLSVIGQPTLSLISGQSRPTS